VSQRDRRGSGRRAHVGPSAQSQNLYLLFAQGYGRRGSARSRPQGTRLEPLVDRTEIYAFEDWWKRIEALIGQADTVVLPAV